MTELTGEIVEKDLPANWPELKQETIQTCERFMELTAYDTPIGDITEQMKDIKRVGKSIEDVRKATVKPLNDTVKRINAEVKTVTSWCERAEKHGKTQVMTSERLEAEKKAKAAMEEQKRIERNAEKRAKRAEEKGDVEAAENIRAEAEMEAESTRAVMENEAPEKQEGVSKRQNWKVEVVDAMALLKCILEGTDKRVGIDVIAIDQKALDARAKAMKEAFDGVPGCRVYAEEVVAVRT